MDWCYYGNCCLLQANHESACCGGNLEILNKDLYEILKLKCLWQKNWVVGVLMHSLPAISFNKVAGLPDICLAKH